MADRRGCVGSQRSEQPEWPDGAESQMSPSWRPPWSDYWVMSLEPAGPSSSAPSVMPGSGCEQTATLNLEIHCDRSPKAVLDTLSLHIFHQGDFKSKGFPSLQCRETWLKDSELDA